MESFRLIKGWLQKYFYMPESQLTFSLFKNRVDQFKNGVAFNPTYLFRGQSNSAWTLKPSFTRVAVSRGLSREQALKLEFECAQSFALTARRILPVEQTRHLDSVKIDTLGWLTIMQHYSAPTRLLDWASSPWVALYFACCSNFDIDGKVFVLDFESVCDFSDQEHEKETKKLKSSIQKGNNISPSPFLNDLTSEYVHIIRATSNSERIDAQQGRFSMATNPLMDHYEFFKKINSLSCEIIIPKNCKKALLLDLREMNISSKTLFPDIDGLGKSINEFCDLWSDSGKININYS